MNNNQQKPSLQKTVIYARVSSKEQEKEGFSIPAQLKLLNKYASDNRLQVVQEYLDVETAKKSGRTGFNEMMKFLGKEAKSKYPSTCRTLLVEKTDRLYRNLKDWVTLDELDLEIHFVKENVILSQESRSSEKFMHGIKVLMAKNYIDNLSEETKKGMFEKAEQGIYPSFAPLGYINVECNGKRFVQSDPVVSHQVVKLFEWYATGNYSINKKAVSRSRLEAMYMENWTAGSTRIFMTGRVRNGKKNRMIFFEKLNVTKTRSTPQHGLEPRTRWLTAICSTD
jgi:site-specific DNA recombinase